MDSDIRNPLVPSGERVPIAGEHGVWAEKYLAAWGDGLGAHSDLVRDVESDELDHERIETEIQQLLPTIDVVEVFCGKCRHMFCHWPDLSTIDWATAPGRSFGSIFELEAAARVGCKSCAFFLSRLVYTKLLDTFRKIQWRLASLGHDGATSLTIQNWGFGLAQSQLIWLNFPGKEATHCNNTGGQAVQIVSSVVNPSAISWQRMANIFELARMWLRQCVGSHKACRNVQEYKRSARLLSFDRDVARLVLTETFSSMPQYATLSYCWGHEPFMMLTVETMNSFLEGFAISDLPKVFQDAIHVARELGLSYIWIDALCIIQQGDDNNDWLTESSHMRSVYGNSLVNLAASSATNVHQSFFSKPDHYTGGFYARITTSKCCTVQSFHSQQPYEESVTQTHLATRAWAFQERILPVRTMFIGNSGVFWECRSKTRSEFLPDGFPPLSAIHLVCPEDQGWDWSQIVRGYSRASLTIASDRLPALAGVARRQHEATGERYLAGMWRERLLYQLPWSVYGERRKRPAWRAPSWSWMSVDGRASSRPSGASMDGLTEYISVLDAWTTPSGPDLFGPVSSGLLSIKCSALVRAELLDPGRSEAILGQKRWCARSHFVKLEGAAFHFCVSIDALEDEWDCNEVYLLPVFGGLSGSAIHHKNKGEGEGEGQDLVSNDSDSDEVQEEQLHIRGLVLQARGKDVNNEERFSRVGSFNFESFKFTMRDDNDDELDRDYYTAFIQILDAERPKAAEAEYFSTPFNRKYSESCINITIE